MTALDDAARTFLACRRIAVAGVSRDGRQAANAIYRKLRATGHEVFAINPQAARVEGDPCYPDLKSIPDGVQAVVVATPPSASLSVVQACVELGIGQVWLHRGIGPGSVTTAAAAFGREHGLTVIAGACPMMYLAPVDLAHRCVKTLLGWFGKLPRLT